MKILVYAKRDWSFMNIEPVLEGLDYRRWDVTARHLLFEEDYFDLVITCEPMMEEWIMIYRDIQGKVPVLAMQQSLYWNDKPNPRAAWHFDKIMTYGELSASAYHMHGLKDKRIIITGNPRYDKYFFMGAGNKGYTLCLGSGGEGMHVYEPHMVIDKDMFIPHPNMINHTLKFDTVTAIRFAKRVIFRSTGAGIIAMIMNKPCLILQENKSSERRFVNSKLYNTTRFGTDPEFVKLAVGGPGATERVKKVIDNELSRIH